MPFRVLKANPNARWRLAGIATGATGLVGYNLSYPEYFDIPDSIRWGSFLVMLPSKEKDEYGQNKPNYVLIVPRTREWGAFFGSLTYAMEKMFSDNPTDFGKFSATMAPQLFPLAEVPVPQIIGELLQQQANWDYYWSSPIVSEALQQLPAEEQVTPWTSRTIEEVSKTIGVSPVRTQHFANGIFGGASQTFTSVADYILNLLSPLKVEKRIVELANQYKAIETDEGRDVFLANIKASTQNQMFNYLRRSEREGQIPVLSAIGRRIIPERGGQLRRTKFEEMRPFEKVLPAYLEKSLSEEQIKALDVKALGKTKIADTKLIEDYDIATEGMKTNEKENYRAKHPEIDAALHFWGRTTTYQSDRALQLLRQKANSLGIPYDAIPALTEKRPSKQKTRKVSRQRIESFRSK